MESKEEIIKKILDKHGIKTPIVVSKPPDEKKEVVTPPYQYPHEGD